MPLHLARKVRRGGSALVVAFVTTATVLVGCGSVSTVPHVPSFATSSALEKPASLVAVTFSIGVLSPSAHPTQTEGKSAWFSPATRSISISYQASYNSKPKTIAVNVGPGVADCMRQSEGDLCSIVVNVPASVLGFNISAFDKPLTTKGRVSGSELGYALAGFSSKTGKLTFTVAAAWRKVKLLALNTAPTNGSPTNLGLQIAVYDADGFIVYGKYRGGVGVGIATVPSNSNSLTFIVDKLKNGSITSSSQKYELLYTGRGVLSANIQIDAPYAKSVQVLAQITPKMSSPAIAASPPLTSASQIAVPDSKTEWFTQASGTVGKISNGTYSQTALPSGHAVTMLGWAPYDGINYGLAFATAQNTIGLLSPTVEESDVFSGVAVVGVSFDSFPSEPVYALRNGTIAEYSSSTSSTQLIYQAPGKPTLTSLSFGAGTYGVGWYFVDTGNKAIGFAQRSGGSEQGLPSGSGTPAVMAVGPNSVVWTAIQGQSEVVIGSTLVPTALPFTSMAAVPSGMNASMMAATDAAGNIELLDQTGKLLYTYTPPDGAATDIVSGMNQDAFYICATCSNGLHEFLY
jgi:hypothetical protein